MTEPITLEGWLLRIASQLRLVADSYPNERTAETFRAFAVDVETAAQQARQEQR